MTELRQRPERESQPPPATTTHPLPDHSKRDEQEKTDVNLTYSRTKGGGGEQEEEENKGLSAVRGSARLTFDLFILTITRIL